MSAPRTSTSLRWNIATTALLVLVTAAIVWWNIDRVVSHRDGAARATVPILAEVATYVYALSITMFFGAPPVDRFTPFGRRRTPTGEPAED